MPVFAVLLRNIINASSLVVVCDTLSWVIPSLLNEIYVATTNLMLQPRGAMILGTTVITIMWHKCVIHNTCVLEGDSEGKIATMLYTIINTEELNNKRSFKYF